MAPLKSPAEVEGMLCLLKDFEKDEDRSVGQKKSGHKKGGEDPPQEPEDRRVRRGG